MGKGIRKLIKWLTSKKPKKGMVIKKTRLTAKPPAVTPAGGAPIKLTPIQRLSRLSKSRPVKYTRRGLAGAGAYGVYNTANRLYDDNISSIKNTTADLADGYNKTPLSLRHLIAGAVGVPAATDGKNVKEFIDGMLPSKYEVAKYYAKNPLQAADVASKVIPGNVNKHYTNNPITSTAADLISATSLPGLALVGSKRLERSYADKGQQQQVERSEGAKNFNPHASEWGNDGTVVNFNGPSLGDRLVDTGKSMATNAVKTELVPRATQYAAKNLSFSDMAKATQTANDIKQTYNKIPSSVKDPIVDMIRGNK